MGPWDSKLRWQPGGNFQPIRLTCEFNWRECPYAIGKYFWSEVYTDVAEFFFNNNEDLLFKVALLFAISIIVYSIIYWKIRKMKEKKVTNSVLNKIAFDIQDLELRVDMLSYKLQHGTWPSLQEITNIYEIEKMNKDKVRLSVSATDSSKWDKKVWLKQFFTNNYLKIKSSCNLFGRSPSKNCDSRQFEDSKTLPKTSGNNNFDDQNDDESVKEMKIMSNNFSHKTSDNESELEKVNASDNAKEGTNIKALNESNKNKEEIENKNEKLLEVHESQENIKNVREIKENVESFYNNNDKTRIVEEEEEQKDCNKTEDEEQNYSEKDKSISNNLNSSVKLNGALQIVEKNSGVFSAPEDIVLELEKHSLNDFKVFSQPEINFNPPTINNLPTIDSTFKFTKPRREKAAKKSLEDVKKRLENLYCVLQMYENQQKLNSTESTEEEVAKKLLAQTFIQELSDFSMISESENDDVLNINHGKKYSQVINPVRQVDKYFSEIKPNDKQENYEGSSVEDDTESCRSNQTEKKQEIAVKCKDDITVCDEPSRETESNSLMLEQHLMRLHTENSIKLNGNLMRIDKPLIELQEDKSSEEENKFNESYSFFINSKSLYQSNLSDIISESDQIEETDATDNNDAPNIVFNGNKIDFYYEDDDNLKSKNIWNQMVINSDAKKIENCQKAIENKRKDPEQLIDILDSNSLLDKENSGFFKKVPENHTDELQIDGSHLNSFKCLQDIFMSFENFDAFRDDLIDLNDDKVEKNTNHDMTEKDQYHEDKLFLDTEKSHLKNTDNMQVSENSNNLDTKNLKVGTMNEDPIKDSCVAMTGKNYLISGKTFIKESIKKTFENNFEDRSLVELHSINLSSEHRISHDITDNIEKIFKDINSDENLNSINVLPGEDLIELKEKIIFDEKSDVENSEIILNKLLINNNCENLSEIEFDVGLEMLEHSKSECEKNSLLNILSESSSLYLTGEGSFSDISNNEKITDLIELNNSSGKNELTFGYNKNEEQESQKNKKKEDDEERFTIASKDSAFYGTPQSSVITINNIDAVNNHQNLDMTTSHDNFNHNEYSFEKELPQNKLKSPKKPLKLEKGKIERATVKTGKSSSISTSREPMKLSDEKINRFPTHSNVKSNNSLRKDMKGSKQKPTEEHKRNDNLHNSKISAQNDAKATLKDLKTNKLSLKAKSNLNLFKGLNDLGQDLKKKGLEGRSKSYITPRKLESTSRNIFNSLVNKKQQRNHSLVDRNLEKSSESSRLSLCERKSTMSSKLDLDSKSRSRESINKSWKSNIPVLKSRIELSKNKTITNNSHKNVSTKESSLLDDTENILSCIKSNKNIKCHQNNFSSRNYCIGLCKKFNQASAECREVCVQEKNTVIKDLEKGRNCEGSLFLQEAQKMIYVNIVTNQQDTRTKLIDLNELLKLINDREFHNQSICKNNNGSDFEVGCICSKLLEMISTLGQENQIVYCQQKEMEVLVKPSVVDTSTSISDLTRLINRNFVPGDNEIINDKCIKFRGDSDQLNNSYNFQEFRSCEEILQQIQNMKHVSDLDICRMS